MFLSSGTQKQLGSLNSRFLGCPKGRGASHTRPVKRASKTGLRFQSPIFEHTHTHTHTHWCLFFGKPRKGRLSFWFSFQTQKRYHQKKKQEKQDPHKHMAVAQINVPKWNLLESKLIKCCGAATVSVNDLMTSWLTSPPPAARGSLAGTACA